jgi:phytoene synthase
MTLVLDPDRTLALSYVPARIREAVGALWRLDVALGSVLATGRDEMVSRIRLAWWREALEKLDRGPPPPEPILQALAHHVLPRGIRGAELAEMEQGWVRMLPSEPLTSDALAGYAANRGGRLFLHSARLLGGHEEQLAVAGGEAWALIDLARRSSSPADVAVALEAGRRVEIARAWPRPLRPLGMLAMLARRDLGRSEWEEQGSPSRMLLMLRHRFTGH